MPEAIILAGGLGTRLREIVPDLPKPMAPIAGKPFLEILLDSLSRKGFDHVILSLGFMAETISSHFGDTYADMPLSYIIEDSPLGTGGATRIAIDKCSQDHVFIFNGDTYLDLEIDAIEQHWQQNKNPIIVARQVSDTARYGRLLTNNGQATKFAEKGITGPGLINAGCYVFHSNQLNAFPLQKNFSLETGFLIYAVSEMLVDVFVTKGQFIDIGVPDDYQRAQTELANL